MIQAACVSGNGRPGAVAGDDLSLPPDRSGKARIPGLPDHPIPLQRHIDVLRHSTLTNTICPAGR